MLWFLREQNNVCVTPIVTNLVHVHVLLLLYSNLVHVHVHVIVLLLLYSNLVHVHVLLLLLFIIVKDWSFILNWLKVYLDYIKDVTRYVVLDTGTD